VAGCAIWPGIVQRYAGELPSRGIGKTGEGPGETYAVMGEGEGNEASIKEKVMIVGTKESLTLQ
jgi:hypothetical protein